MAAGNYPRETYQPQKIGIDPAASETVEGSLNTGVPASPSLTISLKVVRIMMNSAVGYVNATLAGLAWISICAAGLGTNLMEAVTRPTPFPLALPGHRYFRGLFSSCGERRNPGRQQDAREYFLSSHFRHFSLSFGVMVYVPCGHI